MALNGVMITDIDNKSNARTRLQVGRELAMPEAVDPLERIA
jgi:hypothetical protein